MMFSFKARLLAGITLAAILPFAALLAYIDHTNQQLLVEKITVRQAAMQKSIRQSIETDLAQLQREARFIASLDLMDDIMAGDADKRILKLLTQKKSTLKLDAELSVTDVDGECIAATDRCVRGDEDVVRVSNPIYASFDSRSLGTLDIAMPYERLAYYLPKQTDSEWNIRQDTRKIVDNGATITASEENIALSLPFELGLLEAHSLHVIMQRSALVATLRNARYKTLAAALIGLVLILLTSHYLSRFFSRPLGRMSHLMHQVVQERRYDLRSSIRRGDEIGILSESIDALLQTTQDLIDTLAEESTLRLKRFVALSNIFNAITRSNDESEIDQLVKKCLSDDFFEKDPEQYEIFIEAVSRMAKLQKERLLLQRTQLRLLEETNDALKTKSEFLSQVSHEFRTPLNSIIGFSQFMEQEKLVAEPYEKLPLKVEKAGKHLLEMINQLLELAQNESVTLQPDIKLFDLSEVCTEVIELVTPLAEKNATLLRFEPLLAPCMIHADTRMLRQVLFNLIGNAIKFSPDAQVNVDMHQDDEVCETVIKDTGIGMKADEMVNIFTPFVRLSNSAEFKGTGLGLPLAKAYIETFGGTIHAQSKGVGLGSTFTVRLPKNIKEIS